MRSALAHATRRAVVWTLVLGAALILGHWLSAGPARIIEPPAESTTYGQRLAAQHDCWTASSGRHDLPNAAVVTFDDDVAPRYTTDPVEVDKAFDAALGENVPGLYSVTALCLD